ncbi:MAG: hypothetical protein PHX54_09425 [Lentimicrobiaceae bacterium]|nr:hypothetical protein [Lentimicrobiaceae bacterium]
MKAVELNHENYAVFAIDYLEGRLNAETAAAFLSFLDKNPQLKKEFSDLSKMVSLPLERFEMPLKQALKQEYDPDAAEISLNNYDYYFIAWFENDLSETGRNKVSAFLKEHSELTADFEYYAQSRLHQQNQVVYPRKESLKRQVILPLWMKVAPIIAVAASVLFLISIYLRTTPETDEDLNKALGGNEMVMPSIRQDPSSAVELKSEARVEYNEPSTPTGTVKGAAPVSDKQPTVTSPSREATINMNHLPVQGVTLNITEPFNGKPRQVYSQLFDEIQLSQELMLATAEAQPETKRKPVNQTYGRVVNQIIDAGSQIVSQLPSALDPWALADLGVNGINALTSSELKIKRTMDEQGKTKKLQLVDREREQSFLLKD